MFEDIAVNDCGSVGTKASLTARGVGVVAAQAFVGGVMVHHRVHATGSDAKIEPRLAEFLEVAQVVAPVRLWDKSYMEAVMFQNPTNDGSPKRRVVNVCIARDEHHIHFVPTTQVSFFLYYGEPV